MEIISSITSNLDIVMIACVLLGGLFAKKYVSSLKWDTVHKTLLVGSLFAAIYVGILAIEGKFVKTDLSKYFFSYAVATSLYELVLKYAINMLSSKLGVKVPEDPISEQAK